MAAEQKTVSREIYDPRVPFAAERTLLAWVRTGLAMMGFGFVVARFGFFLRESATTHLGAKDLPVPAAHHIRFSLLAGTILVALGVVTCAFAAVQHIRFLVRFQQGLPWRPSKTSLGIIVAFMLAAVGVAMTVYLVIVR